MAYGFKGSEFWVRLGLLKKLQTGYHMGVSENRGP